MKDKNEFLEEFTEQFSELFIETFIIKYHTFFKDEELINYLKKSSNLLLKKVKEKIVLKNTK